MIQKLIFSTGLLLQPYETLRLKYVSNKKVYSTSLHSSNKQALLSLVSPDGGLSCGGAAEDGMPVFAHGGAMHKALAETGGLLWTDSRFEPRTPCRVDELQELTLEAARAICYAKFPDLRCSITAALLQDPVSASDGIMYSGPALRRWWEGKHIFTSPLTGAVLATNHVRPAFAVSALTQQLLNDAIDSGKAAALAGYQGDMDDAVEIANTMATLAGEICPPDDFLRRLHDLCADAHLRDFAGACGALGVAAACFTARQNSVTVAFLVRMLAFQAEHQEKLAWMIPVAVAGLSGSDAERHSLCFQVLRARLLRGRFAHTARLSFSARLLRGRR